MAKKKNSKLRKEREETLHMISFLPMIPKEKHPNEDQEDPINGKYEKTIEMTAWGPDWR
jgi:hypothetical protein